MSASSTGSYIPPHRRHLAQKEKSAASAGSEQGAQTIKNRPPPRLQEHALASVHELCDAFTLVYCINLRRRQDRWEQFSRRLETSLGRRCQPFIDKVQRFDAVDGAALLKSMEEDNEESNIKDPDFPHMEWDASNNALYDRHIQPPMTRRMTPGEVGCALSHVKLWRRLVEARDEARDAMLILEDDAVFYGNKPGKRCSKGKNGPRRNFLEAFSSLWTVLPTDWDILYLGLSWRGERTPATPSSTAVTPIDVHVFRPTYGFHTHAYALTKSAAEILLQNGPVCGPLDVWLADNAWFGLNVYCSVVANEGYNKEGSLLVSQRKRDTNSDIVQSGRARDVVY